MSVDLAIDQIAVPLSEEDQSLLKLMRDLEAGELNEVVAQYVGFRVIATAVKDMFPPDLCDDEKVLGSCKRMKDGCSSLIASSRYFEHYPEIERTIEEIRQLMSYCITDLAHSTKHPAKSDQKFNTYIVRNPTNGMVKIGRTTDVEFRTKTLSSACGSKLQILAVIGDDVESMLHDMFKGQRQHGEWFSDEYGAISDYAKSIPQLRY